MSSVYIHAHAICNEVATRHTEKVLQFTCMLMPYVCVGGDESEVAWGGGGGLPPSAATGGH